MNRFFCLLLLLGLVSACGPRQLEPDEAFVCDNCEDWNQPQAPFRIYGNTWFVGTAGLSSILVETGEGLALFDGALPQSAERIVENIRSIGFDPLDIAAIFVSHAHFDHAGGVAALQRYTGATVYTSSEGRKALLAGALQPDDPQYSPDDPANFPAVASVVAVADDNEVQVGDLGIKAIYTPGHTPGGTSWTWESCALGTCNQVVYADSLTAVSAKGYRFSAGPAANQLIASADRISLLDCDILLSPHPFFFGMQDKLERRGDGNPFVNNVACAIYAETILDWLEQRLRAEGYR